MTLISPPNVCAACSPLPGWREVSPSPPDPSRLSLNQKTTNNWSVREAAEGCARADIGYIGLWRDKVSETGLSESARKIGRASCRGKSVDLGGRRSTQKKHRRSGQ